MVSFLCARHDLNSQACSRQALGCHISIHHNKSLLEGKNKTDVVLRMEPKPGAGGSSL
jgi:hypothetical protein